MLTSPSGDRIEAQKEKIRKDLESLDDELALEDQQFPLKLQSLMDQVADQQRRHFQAQATRRQKKLRLRKQLNLLTDREKVLWADDLRALKTLERIEYEAALRDELALYEGHPYEAALKYGYLVPAGEAPPSPSQLPALTSNLPVPRTPLSLDEPLVAWPSDPEVADPDSEFWKTVDFGGGIGLSPAEHVSSC